MRWVPAIRRLSAVTRWKGHVPASDIKRMLTEKPAIRGLAVPGMPMGSPGMEYGDRKDAYDTISYTKDGKTSVYASH